MAEKSLQLPIIDLSAPDRLATAASIRKACLEHGFFYLVNHGVEDELFARVVDESKKFFSLSSEDKMKLQLKEERGFIPLYFENNEPTVTSKGDSKETFYIGPVEGPVSNLNQWPSTDVLPCFRSTVEAYYQKAMSAGKSLASLIALSLDLDEDFFIKVGALDLPSSFFRLLHYPGELEVSEEEIYGASAHSDYGMITLLADGGVSGLQVCRDKSRKPRVWEDVPSLKGALIVNIGDTMERCTNCLYRSTMHRVMPTGKERFSAAFFLVPNREFVVECFESCMSESRPARFPPVSWAEYLKEKLRLAYSSVQA